MNVLENEGVNKSDNENIHEREWINRQEIE